MTALQGKARTADTYLAGLGASGALVAGAIVAFVMLVGAVSFSAWPDASGLFTFSGGQADIGSERSLAPAAGPSAPPGPLSVGGAPSAGSDVTRSGADRSGTPNVKGGTRGGRDDSPAPGDGGAAEPGRMPGGAVPGDEGRPSTESPNLLSNVGDSVERNTSTLGDTLNEVTGTQLGTPVASLGKTLNNALQLLSGAVKEPQ